MPRALWTGSLSFGLVNVPVQLISAVRDLDLHFRQLHEKDGAPIDVQRWCSDECREIPYEQIARSYELDDGEEVVVTDEELEAVEPRRTRTIDIEQFVELVDVDPVHLVHPYLVIPGGDSEGTLRAYRLLVDAMSRTDRAALGRFVMRAKEYLALVRVRDGVLTLSTMRFHDEVRDHSDVPGHGGRKAPKRQREELCRIIEALSVDWDAARYEDSYRERLKAVVKQKKAGRKVRIPKEEEPAPAAPDLMAALERSMAEVMSRRKGGDGGTAKGDGGGNGRRASRDGGDRAELADLSKGELYERAKRAEVPGRSQMTRDELIEALSGR